MGKLKNYLLTTTCLVILVGALTLFSPVVQQVQGDPPTRDVNVVNTPTNPVPVVVQNGDADGVATELFELVVLNVTGTVNLFTVPTDKRLLITDVIVSGAVSNSQILRGTSVVSNIIVLSSQTYEHSYVSGIEFASGETRSISPGSSGQTNWELRGFLETLPPS